MALQRSLLQYLCSVLLLVGAASALKFDLIATAEGSKKERCIRNFVGKDTLVVVTATVDGFKGDGMMVNLYVCCLRRLREREGCLMDLDRFAMPLATSTVALRTLLASRGLSLPRTPTLPLTFASRMSLLAVSDDS